MAQDIFIQTCNGTSGPFGSKQIRHMAANGQLRPDDLISFDGTKWGAASGLKGLEFPAAAEEPPRIDLAKAAEKAGKSMLSTLKGAAGVVSIWCQTLSSGSRLKDRLPRAIRPH